MLRKESPKLIWQDLPKEALQSSLLDWAGVKPERKTPEVSWTNISLLCFFRLISGVQICVTSGVKAANKVNSESIFCFVLFSGNTGLPQKRILEYQSETRWANQLFTAVLSISLFHCLQEQCCDRGLRGSNWKKRKEPQVPSSLVLFVKPK